MKLHHVLILTVLAITTSPAAEPEKRPLADYRSLWMDSPFTAKPPPIDPLPVVNPLDAYALIGVSPIGDGYRVTLIDRKNPDARITVEPGHPRLRLLSISRLAGDPLGTVVRMAIGKLEGNIGFESDFLAVSPPLAVPDPPTRQQPQPRTGLRSRISNQGAK